MRYAMYALGGLVLIIAVIVAIGYALPVRHSASRSAEYPLPAERLFALVSTPADYPRWRRNVQRVDMLPPTQGRTRFEEVSGSDAVTYEIERSIPNSELRVRIADESLPYGGTWTYEIEPIDATRSRLRITEDGEVYNPIFRFVSRFILGHTSTIDAYLADLGRAATR